ncbi:DUF2312 domain-containing protein [Rhizobium phaseoli]|uniref:DUF2312 domain-containing protein n=1 Tax=Rhizobium phaseoli TaxID=396 RepID=UPI0002F04076|nr:DUF2312 domain-containing protein [Rhizobium phaseoli]KKZ89034.1 hypothetical protein RPHASCH2410_CH00125 [Rhizobium phaseoli Ch24-10]
MTADKQLKAYIDRVLRLKEEQDALGQDIRDVYAEAKAEGYDKTIMGKLVAHLRRELKQGAGAVAEAESIFDTYLHAYQRASGMPVATHTHEEEFDPITGEFVDDSEFSAKLVATVATGMQTEIGRKALGAAIDIMIAREEAEEESRANVEEEAADESAAVSDDPASRASEESERQRASMVGFADDCRTGGKEQMAAAAAPVGDADAEANGIPALNSQSDDDAFAEVKGRARLANADGVEPSSSGHTADQPLAGGDHVTAQTHSAAKAGALVKPAPALKPLRPYCRNPGDRCGGYGSTHCASCLKAAKQAEVAA